MSEAGTESDSIDGDSLRKKNLSDSTQFNWLSRNNCVANPSNVQDKEAETASEKEDRNVSAEAHTKKSKKCEGGWKEGDENCEFVVMGPNRVLRQRRCSVSEQNQLEDKMRYAGLNPMDSGVSIRRTKSLSMNSNGHIEEPKREKGGFFRSLFGRRKKEEPKPKPVESASSAKPRRHSTTTGVSPASSPKPPQSAPSRTSDEKKESSERNSPMPPLMRSKTVPTNTADANIRLEEFLDRYRAKENCPAPSQFKPIKMPKPEASKPKATFSIDEDLETYGNGGKSGVLRDAKGRPIPPHPSKSNLPPALKRTERPQRSKEKLKRTNTNNSSTPNKFGAFLRRVTSHTDEHSYSSKQSLTDSDTESSDEELPQILEDGMPQTIPGLEDLKPFKKVSFATNTYFNDPPQQICSKNPRRGEVEVKPDGSVIIHRLTPEEKREILQKTSSGIVVGGSGHLKLLSDPTLSEEEVKRKEEKKPVNANKCAEQDGTMTDPSASEKAAQKAAESTSEQVNQPSGDNEEEVIISKSASEVKIDKPMISRRSASSLSTMIPAADPEEDDDDNIFPPPGMKIPHDLVYTRCCHLREILPIPATLKQLKKGSTDPIPLLQMRNPKPSLIEVLSFSDFLGITPVLCLSLDGVNLSAGMLRIILCSLMNKKHFEKLSLRNTPLDHEGWKILCYFISQCKSLNSIDLTMVPGISINVQKPSKSSQRSRIVRMTCSMTDRKEMNWNLLVASLISVEGLEEIIISGAKMSLKEFKDFLQLGCTKTLRLGLAYNELTTEQCNVLAGWLAHSNVTGIDIGFNDLRGKLGAFASGIIDRTKSSRNVFKYFSLSSTNLEVSEDSTPENDDFLKLISVLCYCEDLKLLDISNNPKLFPYVTSHLTNYMPVFVNLIRLHMDNNNIPAPSVVALAEVLPMCQKLSHVSMRGTKLDYATGCALAAAMRQSSSLLTIDLDAENLPNKIKDKMSLYSMKNMEKTLNRVDKSTSPEMSDTLACLQKELADLLTEQPNKQDVEVMAQNFLLRLSKARSFIKKVTEDLFKLRVEGNLSTGGKETLIRFCFIDATFERGLQLLAQRYSYIKVDSEISEDDAPSKIVLNSMSSLVGSHMKRQNSSVTISSNHFAESGHASLLPFHYPPVGPSDPADDEVEIKDHFSSANSHARDQLREEGSIFKKTHGIIEHVKSSEKQQSITGQAEHANLTHEKLKSAAYNMDSEQIKEYILNHNISSAADVLEDLRSKGVSLHDIFKKRPEDSSTNNRKGQNCHKDTANGNTVVGVEANLLEEQQRLATSDNESISSEDSEGEEIDRVYDEVLNDIQRVRTNTDA